MKVALFGSTGFVGSYIVKKLISEAFIPRVLVRKESELKITSGSEVVYGNIKDRNSVLETIEGTDAVIYNIGIIREIPKKNLTFKELHFDGVNSCIEIAKSIGVKRFILMSANGVKSDGTAYQKTKWQADEALKKSGLNWTIFRPSLIFGDPEGQGRPEFCTHIRDDMLSLPIPAPLFYEGPFPFNAGSFAMSPIHVDNVADFFVKAITQEICYGKVYNLGGTDSLTWKEILHQISLASKKHTWKIPAPIFIIKMLALILDRFEWFPVTWGQLTMLMEGNTVDDNYFDEFSIIPKHFIMDNLIYLSN